MFFSFIVLFLLFNTCHIKKHLFTEASSNQYVLLCLDRLCHRLFSGNIDSLGIHRKCRIRSTKMADNQRFQCFFFTNLQGEIGEIYKKENAGFTERFRFIDVNV